MGVNHIKVWLVIISCAIILIFAPSVSGAVNNEQEFNRDEIINGQLDKLDLMEMERFINDLNRETNALIPDFNLRQFILQVTRGGEPFNVSVLVAGLLQYLFKELLANSRLLGQLLILAVVAAILQNIQRAFADETIGKMAYGVCFLVLLTLAIQTFAISIDTGKIAIDRMVTFMQALLPVLLALLTAVGGIATAAIFHPLLVMVITVMATLIKILIFPLIYIGVVLSIISHIAPGVSITRLAGLLHEWSVILLGLVICIFMGVLVVQGVTASVSDGISMRAVKFLTGTFVPIVGKMFVDAIDAIAGCSLLLKNAIGVLGVIAVFLVCAFPLLKLTSLILIYKVTAAIIQPISEEGLVRCINSLANSLTVVLVTVATVGVMFFITITVVIGVGNMTVMLR
ncbi:MAG: stage III sporulation protein AE [bacterium]|jgi:stage III sporulation protein AE